MKNRKFVLILFLLSALILASCQSNESTSNKEVKTIKIASHTAPMTDIIDLISEDVLKEGYEIELVKVSDNVQANVALHNKEVDANFFQHELFMEMYNEKNGANLTVVQPVYNAIVAFYGKDIASVDDVKDGMSVAVPSDPTNMTRALRLLQDNGLIELKDKDSYKLSLDDIAKNSKNLDIIGISLLNLNEAYNEKDLIFNYPTYIAKIGLTPAENGVMVEDLDSKFAISLIAREDNASSDGIKVLVKNIKSDKVKKFIEEKLKGHAEAAF